MKTAISIPDDIFDSAEALADQLGMSRSKLYSLAVAEYVAKHRSGDVTARLDAIYGEQDNRLPTAVRKAQAKSIRRPSW